MKKIFALILTFALALTAASVPAFAADTDTIGKGGAPLRTLRLLIVRVILQQSFTV